jgi:hypothetical protein
MENLQFNQGATSLTDEQKRLRLGKFTGSGMYKLMTGGRRDMTDDELIQEKKNKGKRKTVDIPFGDVAMTYIYEKVAERLTGCIKDFKPTQEMLRGIELEAEAKQYYQAATGNTITKLKPIVSDYTSYNPDGWVDELKSIIEIECPNSDNHLKYFLGNQEYIKTAYPLKYWQMYFYMWKTSTTSCFFCSYDPRFKDAKMKMLFLKFKVNPSEMVLMINKLNLAIVELRNIITKLPLDPTAQG